MWPHGFAARTVMTRPLVLTVTGETTGGLRGGAGKPEPLPIRPHAGTASIRAPAASDTHAASRIITAPLVRCTF